MSVIPIVPKSDSIISLIFRKVPQDTNFKIVELRSRVVGISKVSPQFTKNHFLLNKYLQKNRWY